MSADSKKPPRSPDAFEISKKYSRVLFSMGKRESGQEQQFMEDKKRKKEEKRKREASQKVAEQKNKVTDVTKPAAAQSPATQSSSASPSPGPTPATASPSPATSGPGGAATPSQGGNNAKRLAVANGQPASNTSSSSTAGGLGAAGNGSTGSGGGTQAPQQPSRYMPREVPPRFRCQQDHKVLLKRGQPPLSSMLLGGGGGGGDGPNPNMAAVSDSASSLALTSSIAASTSNYANSMWGKSSGGQASSQGKEKVIVDGNDLEEWPSIAGSDGGNGGNSGMPVNSISASGNQPSPTSSFSLPNECMQLSSSAAWGTTASQGQLGGGAAVAAAGPLLQQPSLLSKAPAVHGSHDASGPVDGSSGIPGANFSPNANPSAWPALVQQDSPAAAGEGALTAFHHQGSGGSANNSASMGLGGGAVGVLGGHTSISVNQSSAHQHQLHQMQSRDREDGGGRWDSESAGPKISGGEGIGGGMDHGVGGGRVGAGDPNVATSWRGQPSYSAAYSKTGVSRTDGWEGGESGGLGAAEGDKGTSGWGYPSSTCGSAENGGNCAQASGATQGGWGSSVVGADRGVSGSGWGGSSAGIGGSNPAPDEMGNCSSNSSSSGGSTVGNPPTASLSLTAAAANRAWDNQKGEGEVGEWGDGAGGRGGSSSSGGNSRSGSMTNSNRIRRQAPNAEAALQNLLSRSDLDPRVLSNSGWGQTQIRQNTSWDVEEQEGQNKAGPPSASSKHPAALGGPTQYSSGPRTLSTDSKGPGVSPSLIPPTGSSGEGWESSSSSSSGASLSGRAPPPTSSNMRHLGVSQSGPVTSSEPGLASGIMPGTQTKATGWVGGGNGAGDNLDSKDWGNEEWRSNSQAEKGGGWGDVGQKGDSSGGGWGDGHHEKGAGSWKDMGGSDEGSGWGSKSKVGAGKNWLERESKSSSGGGWGDERRNGGHSGGDSGGGGWGNWDSSAPRRTWGTGGGGGGGGGMDGVGGMGPKPHQSWSGGNKMHQMPNSQSGSVSGPQAQLQQQQSQPRNQNPQLQQALDQGVMQGGGGRKLASQAQTQNQSSGWTSGPLPCAPVGGGGPEPSGWEEPSPQSISRKSEIDDGTSAWGDPTHYNYKPVNLWDKNSGSASQQPHGQSQAQQQQQGAPVQQQPSRQAAALTEPSGWSSTSPASPSVDNGTAAWGKPNEAPTDWGDPDDTGGKTGSWGNPSNSIRSASKSMQDGWGDKESSMAASRHSSWEDEEEGSSMWNSTGSQGSGSSWGQGSNGGWAQSNPVKKTSSKGPLKAGGDSWMSPINRQFSNMGILNDDPSGPNIDLPSGSIQEKKMEAEKRSIGLNDYNGDMRKGGRGGGPSGGGIYRPPGSKDPAQLDAGSYYDKALHLISQDGCLGEEAPYSLYSPPTAYKPHTLFNHSVPFRQGGHSIFGNAGGMSQSRHQPSVPPMNQSPGMRAQVPHQFLSPQVPGSMLKPMPPPSGSVGGVGGMGGVAGVGGGVFAPQLSPQHLAMLSSIYPPQIQLQLACQLLLQQQQQQQPPQQQQILQNQRKFTPNVRQQNDPQQLARLMAVLQQQRQHQQIGGLGSGPKLSPSHHSGMGPKLPGSETLPHPGLGGSVAELQQKAFGPYSGFGSAVNLPGLEHGASMMGGPGGMKDLGAQQSRFKWMMEGNCSPDTSSPDNLYHKNGPVTPIKMPGSSPYSQFDIVGDGPSDNWHRTPGNKMGAKTTNTPSWPPEFQPGVPWKGIDRVDPESDPYMTPGSMMGNAVSPGLNDSEHQLLQDNTDSTPPLNTLLPSPGAWPYSASDILNNAHNSAKYTEYKTSWPPEPPGHKSWKASRGSSQAQLSRPPPGLASQKQASPSPWSGGAPRSAGRGWGSGSSNTGSAWSDGSSRESCWLVLSNLTPQIDGSTLRTICMQHGPLLTFHLGLTQGTALIRYCSKQEAAKAQSALHMCVLGNTTILAEFVSEEEVGRYIAHSQAGSEGNAAASAGLGPTAASAVGTGTNGGSCERGGAGGPGGGGVEGASPAGVATSSSSGWQSLDSTGSSSDPSAAQGPGLGIFTQWSSNGSGVGGAGAMEAGRQGLWGGIGGMSGAGYPSGGSSLWASPALEDRHQMGSPAALLPGDLLGGGADSI